MCITRLVWGFFWSSLRDEYKVKDRWTGSPYAGLLKWHYYPGPLSNAVSLTWLTAGCYRRSRSTGSRRRALARTIFQATPSGPFQPEPLTLDSIRAALTTFERSVLPKELEAMQISRGGFWAATRLPSASEAASWMNAALLPRPRLAASRVPLCVHADPD